MPASRSTFWLGVVQIVLGVRSISNLHSRYETGISRYLFAGWFLIGALTIFRSFKHVPDHLK
jgi:hypothetical protein